MSTQRRVHRSFRLRPDTSARLESRAAETGDTYTALAERFIDEGLRRVDHSGIDFVDGPAGRRARVVGTGLGVWEVIEVLRANDGSAESAADYLAIPAPGVRSAMAYYRDFPDEIDTWIQRNRAIAAREEAKEEAATAAEQGKRINVVLDVEHDDRLTEIAARLYVQPGTVARSLLSTALDQVDPEAATITALLDSIPGAWERTMEGVADARAGRVVPLDQL